MAGSFTSPGISSSTKMKHGKANRPRRTAESARPFGEKQHDPLRHASAMLPPFSDRHKHTNGKMGFHTQPPRPPAGRLAKRPGPVNRGSGKEHRAQG